MRRVWLNYTKGDVGYEIDPNELASIKNIDSKGSFQFWENGVSLGFHLTGCTITYNNVWMKSRSLKFEDYQFNQNGSNLCFTLNLNELWEKAEEPQKNILALEH